MPDSYLGYSAQAELETNHGQEDRVSYEVVSLMEQTTYKGTKPVPAEPVGFEAFLD